MKKTTCMILMVLALGVLTIAAAPAGQETVARPVSQLEINVLQAIRMAPHYGVFDNLAFQLQGNEVILTGQVLLPITRTEITSRVAKLAGIASVKDAIEVLPLSASDDSLRLRVYRGLFGKADLYRYALGANPSIHIIVKGSRVTLEGVVSSEADRRFAANAARRVNGVLALTNNLKVEG